MKFLTELRTRWKGHNERRFLESHGCKSWREYHRKHDSDYGPYARTIKSMYHGYPYLVRIDDINHCVYQTNGVTDIEEWCYNNCQEKFRIDWQRVIQNHWGEWEENGIGGLDYVFIAFKSSKDAMLFSLRWS